MKKVLLFASAVIAAAMAFSCNPEEPTVEASLVLKSQEAVTIPAEGASVEVSFVTNQDWTVKSDAAWATVDPAQGKAAEAAQTVKVEVAANDTEAERTATITVKASTIEKKVTVKQAAKAAEDPGENPGGDEPVETITSIATALATPGTYTIQGQVLATCTKGAVLADETAAIYVYKADAAAWEVGATYKVTGPTCVFNFGPELNGFESAEKVSDGTVPATEPTAISVEAAEALIASIDGKDKSKDLVLSCQYVQIEGTLAISGTYYNVTIAGTDKAVASISYPAESLGLAAFDGKYIKVTGYLTSISGGKYLNIVTTAVEEGAAPAQPTGISSAAEYVAFAAAVAAGDYSAFKNDAGEVAILADLDFAGVAEDSVNISKFDGILNGNNHSIKNWSTSSALIETLEETGVIKDLGIEATCSYTIANAVCGVLTKYNNGTIEGVINNAKVTYEGAALTTENNYIGVMSAISKGTVKNCVNNGEVKVHFTSAASKQLHLSGVVASISGTAAVVEGNTNNGAISAEFDNIAKTTNIGGVLASTPATALKSATPTNYINVKNCHNSGNITWKVGVNKNGSYCNVGGVAGYVEGTVEDCTNAGTVHLEGATKCDTSSDITTRQAAAGVAAVAMFGAKSCSNCGTIEAPQGSFAGGTKGNAWCGSSQNPTFGGVVACVGTAYLDGPIKATEEVVDDCHNTGKIEISCDMYVEGGTHILVGGVVGINSGITKNCSNKGELINKAGQKASKFGGVIGVMSNTITDCVNEGTLTHDILGKHELSSVYASQLYMGGVVGYLEISGCKIARCTNKGKLYALNGWNEGALSYFGGVVGTYSGSQNEMEDCINEADLYVDSKASFRIGGLASQMNALVKNCTNNGNITVKNVAATNAGKQTYIGGLLGYHNGIYDENIIGCTNNGNITVENPNQGTDLYVYANGLVAALGNQDNDPYTISFIDCVSAGAVSNPQGRASAIFGCWHSGAPAEGMNYILNLGKEGHPITVKSTCTVNGAKATEATLVNDTFGNTVNTNVVIE